MNQFNALHGEEPNKAPREWNNQPTVDNFKYSTSTPKTSSVVSDIMGRLNHHTIHNGDIEINPLEFPF